MNDFLRRTLFVPVAAVRPYLAIKLTLLMLGFDLWIERASHGGRYGVGGFNVAHFAWLEAIQPAITPALQVGVVVLTGALCVTLALASRPPRWLIAIAFVLHSWTWAMSMLDSYQHHYLLSLVLFTMIFFPRLSAEDALLAPRGHEAKVLAGAAGVASKKKKKKDPAHESVKKHPRSLLDPFPMTSAWGYVLLAASIAVVYAYTAYSKTDPEWLTGAALRRVLHLPESGAPPLGADDPIGPFRALAATFGIQGESFWWTMGHSVVAVQIICASGYLLAAFRDVTTSRVMKAFSWIALFTALSFHVGAEYMQLKIGWFSWYMMGYALIFFLPASWLAATARVLIPLVGGQREAGPMAARIAVGVILAGGGLAVDMWPIGAIGAALILVTPIRLAAMATMKSTYGKKEHTPPLAFASAAVGAIALVAVGYAVDLPGVATAMTVGAVALGAGLVGLLVMKGNAEPIHGYGVGAVVAALSLLVSVMLSDVRWDFYRNIGGDHRRRGEVREAYEAYVKANRYAPEGQDRQAQEDEMRGLLEGRGELPPRERRPTERP